MKKLILILAVMLSTVPALAQANVELGVNMPGLSLHIGDRDPRGYYWDGGDWRPPGWWDEHYRDEVGDTGSITSPSHRRHRVTGIMNTGTKVPRRGTGVMALRGTGGKGPLRDAGNKSAVS